VRRTLNPPENPPMIYLAEIGDADGLGMPGNTPGVAFFALQTDT
jgi:hypothetical protein